MKYLLAALVGVGVLFGSAGVASATEHNGNPVDCVMNPAFAKMHLVQCKDMTLDQVASNGGPKNTNQKPGGSGGSTSG